MINRTAKTRIRMTAALLSAAFAVLIFACASPAVIAADDGDLTLYAVRYSEGIYALDIVCGEDGVTRRKTDERDIRIDAFGGAKWSSGDGTAAEITDGIVSVKGNTVTLDFSGEQIDIAWCHELTAVVSITSDDELTECTLKITTTEGEYTGTAAAETGLPCLLAASLAPIPDGERVTGISISADGASEVSVSDIFADNRTLVDFLDRYKAACFSSDSGSLTTEYGRVVFTPDDSGNSRVYVSSAVRTIPESGRNDYIILTVTSTTDGDGMTLYAGENSLGTAVLSSGTSRYSFAVPSEIPDEISIGFARDSDASSYEIESVTAFSYMSVPGFVTDSLGKVTDVKITKSQITVSGSITSSAVVSHIGSKIGVFEIPLGTKPDDGILENLTPIESFDISTQFNISLPLDAYRLSPETSMYAVAIMTDEGNLFIAEPQCAKGRTQTVPFSKSLVGLYGATTAGIFESNAAHAVFDIDFAKLTGGMSPNKAGAPASYGGRSFYIDEAMIAELDRMIGFCDSANADVYLRIMSSENMSPVGYTYGTEKDGSFMFDISDERGRAYFTAVFSYIANRYPSVAGYIIASPATLSQPGMTDEAHAAEYADTLGIMRNVLGKASSSAVVYATFADDGSDAVTPAIIYKMMDYRLSLYGKTKFGIAWNGTADEYTRFENSLFCLSESGPDNTVMFFHSESDDFIKVADEYAVCVEEAAGIYMRAAFLEVPPELADSGLYDEISTRLNELESSRYTYAGTAADRDSVYTGEAVILDYSSSFSTSGWISGDGCKSLITEQRGYFGNAIRSLEATFTLKPESTSAGGVLIYTPESAIRLSSADAFRTVVYAAADADEVEIRMILSYGDTRYEYPFIIKPNEAAELDCDTSEIADALVPDYIAVVVRCPSEVRLNIAGASALSLTATDSELRDMLGDSRQGTTESTDKTSTRTHDMAIIIASASLGASVIVFALMSKRKKDEQDG